MDAQTLRDQVAYDPQTGVFTRLRANRSVKVGDVMGSKLRDGYLIASVGGKRHLLHRLAWLHYFGEWPSGDLDHINRDKADNRISNLRAADRSQNSWNRGYSNAGNKHGVAGVNAHKKGFRATIKVRGKQIVSKTYRSVAEAAAARASLVTQHYGAFAPNGV